MTVNEINKELLKQIQEPHHAYETYRTYLKELFDSYTNMVEKSKDDLDQYCFIAESFDDLVGEITVYCQQLLEIYDLYMSGRVGEAVERMKDWFTPEESMFTDDVSIETPMYRARVQDSMNMTYDAKKMFHVPFEERGKIANGRFSLAGYPCLYLGKTILACWEEMHKPTLDNLCVAKVVLKEGISKNVINLCWHDAIDTDYSNIDEESIGAFKLRITRLLRRYPLIMACSSRAYRPEAPFKEEYVIPQILLLSCIGNEHVEGIAYTSTRRDNQISNDIELHQNFVFPAQEISDVGYCDKLASEFRITSGLTFMEADIKSVFVSRGAVVAQDIAEGVLSIDNFEYGKTDYQCSKFGQMEDYLSKQPLYKLWRNYNAWNVREVKENK